MDLITMVYLSQNDHQHGHQHHYNPQHHIQYNHKQFFQDTSSLNAKIKVKTVVPDLISDKQKNQDENQNENQNQDVNHDDDDDDDGDEIEYEIELPAGEIKSIQIYWVCLREQKCPELKNSPMLHAKCLKTARLKNNCYIKCDGPCKSFSILNAGFDCSRNEVNKISNLWKSKEMIKTKKQVSAVVKKSLLKSNLNVMQNVKFEVRVIQSAIFKNLQIQ